MITVAQTVAVDRIRNTEELSLNSWPALETTIYDGWLLRVAKGYTRRSNSVSVLYPSKLKLEEKIVYCEAAYAAQQLPTIFKLTPAMQPSNLEEVLIDRGYGVQNPSMVMLQDDLSVLPPPDHTDTRYLNDPSDEWLDSYITLNSIEPKHLPTMKQLLAHIQSPKAFAALMAGGEPVALGLAVVERGYVGFYDIVVSAEQRGRGWGRQLMLSLIHWAKQRGAQKGYLQVMGDNTPAHRLYQGVGFFPAYDYWYRTKENKA